MVEYKFNKAAIEVMYNDTLEECLEALDNGSIDEIEVGIKVGNQAINIPINADYLEDIFSLLKEWAGEED